MISVYVFLVIGTLLSLVSAVMLVEKSTLTNKYDRLFYGIERFIKQGMVTILPFLLFLISPVLGICYGFFGLVFLKPILKALEFMESQ